MAKIDCIREMFYGKGLSISQIARETGHDRKTVRQYVKREDWNLLERQEEVTVSKLDPYKPVIDGWLEEDRKARKKQRHTARRVYDRLTQEYGEKFNCSYRTVAAYVSGKKRQMRVSRECFLPLEHPAGEAQVDFGKAEFIERGMKYSGSYLNVSFPYSNSGYQQLFKGENTECLLEGLKSVFEHIGGVPGKLWFDNTALAVSIQGEKRTLTDAFLRFKNHYGFEAVFCNVGAGHEKGHVEGKVGYHRRNMLVPVPVFNDLKEFNIELLQHCGRDMDRLHYRKEIRIVDLFKQDRQEFLPLPAVPYDVCSYEDVRTDAYGKFTLNKGRHIYSTAPKHANSRVLVTVTAHEVLPLDENRREIVRHKRLYGNWKQESMEWLPYLTQLSRCPGALKYSGIYSILPDPLRQYMDECGKTERGEALKTLVKLSGESNFDKAAEALQQALELGLQDMDSVIALHNRMTAVMPELPRFELPEMAPHLISWQPDMAAYDQIFLQGGGN